MIKLKLLVIFANNQLKDWIVTWTQDFGFGNKVLGLTIDFDKSKGHFSSSNEIFEALISGIGLDTSNSIKTMMYHDNTTKHTGDKESMTMMQH